MLQEFRAANETGGEFNCDSLLDLFGAEPFAPEPVSSDNLLVFNAGRSSSNTNRSKSTIGVGLFDNPDARIANRRGRSQVLDPRSGSIG